MTPANLQKLARRRALRQCEEILSAYLTDWLTDDDEMESDTIEGFEHVDPDIDALRYQILELEGET